MSPVLPDYLYNTRHKRCNGIRYSVVKAVFVSLSYTCVYLDLAGELSEGLGSKEVDF